MADEKLIYMGVALMGVGVLPTPDDVTIISPALQIGVGAFLVLAGVLKKK